MKRSAVVGVAGAVTLFAALRLASGAAGAQQPKSTAQEKLASVDYLLASWKCAHSVGTFSGQYTTTWAKALGGRWLRETYDFPPRQFGGNNQTTVTAEALIGYDEPRAKWVRFFAASTGDYFPIRMKDTGAGWGYRYIDFFGNNPATADETDATFRKKSDTEYVIDGPTYPENGKPVTEHHDCHKL